MTSTAIAPPGATPSRLIAREIRAELARQQMSNRRLALTLGVSSMWVNRRITACDTELKFEDVQAISAVLGVPIRQLLDTWLDYAGSPSVGDTGAYDAEINTQSSDNVLLFPVTSVPLGGGPGVMRTTRRSA